MPSAASGFRRYSRESPLSFHGVEYRFSRCAMTTCLPLPAVRPAVRTASMGETRMALFAGARDARSTVSTPSAAPAQVPGRLTPQTGIQESRSGPVVFISADTRQTAAAAARSPAGTAVRHQQRASRRT